MDYYKVLGVGENADEQEIKKAYRKLSLRHHPDRGGDAEEFKKINEAYSTLGDKTKRQQYNMQKNNPFMRGMPGMGMPGMGGMNDPNIDPILKMFFGGGMPGMGGMSGMGGMPNVQVFRNGRPVNINRVRKPQPIVKSIKISLENAYKGITLPITISRSIIVNNERKREQEKIYVPIKPGIDDGELIILKEKGDIINDTIKGDVKLFVNIENNTKFLRDGLDILFKQEISLKESLTGFKFDIKHLNGKTYTINNDNGNVIYPNYIKKIPELGMNRDSRKGMLIIDFQVKFPDKLTKDQVEKLKTIL